MKSRERGCARLKRTGDAKCRRRLLVFFFFQAEDGIRDYKVTGVQTCALPIWTNGRRTARSVISCSFIVRPAGYAAQAIRSIPLIWLRCMTRRDVGSNESRRDRKSVV